MSFNKEIIKYGLLATMAAVVMSMVACGKKDDAPKDLAESPLRITEIRPIGNASVYGNVYNPNSTYQNSYYNTNQTLLNAQWRITVSDDMNSAAFDITPSGSIQATGDKVGGTFKYRIEYACGDINCVTLALLVQRQRAGDQWGTSAVAYGDMPNGNTVYSYRSRGFLFTLAANGTLTLSRTVDSQYMNLFQALPALGVNVN